MLPQQKSKPKTNKKTTKNDLLKLQRPVYELKRSEEGKVEGIIAKLMQKKQKPQIGFVPRSSLLSQLDQFIPILKQSNNDLMKQQIKPQVRFDARLEEVQDSSSSSSSDDEDKMIDEVEKINQQKSQDEYLQSCDQFQFNILTYPYKNQQGEGIQTKVEEKCTLASKFQKVVEITKSDRQDTIVNQLQKMQ